MHACVRCLLRPQPTYRRRARARPGSAGGDAPRPSPGSAVGPAPPLRPTDGGVRAKPNSQCVASHVFVSAACGAPPSLCAAMWYVRARPAAVRQRQRSVRSATRRPCRGSVGVRRRPRSVHALLRQCAARRGAGQEEGGVRRPHLRHRRVVRGELVPTLCDLARRVPAPIRADSARGPVRRRSGRHSVTRSCS